MNDASDVVLVEPDRAWLALFCTEGRRLIAVAAQAILEVHHVGSTAIPGILAKPIIDVLIILRRFLNEAESVAVSMAGYEYCGEAGIPGRQYFSRRTSPAFHLHAFLDGHAEVGRMLLFRDYLRAHPETAREYEALKRHLAERFRRDRAAYTDAKTDFISSVDAKAALWNPERH